MFSLHVTHKQAFHLEPGPRLRQRGRPRRATDDESAIRRLAALDGKAVPGGRLLVAEADGD